MKSSKPLVSVVLPTHNRPNMTKKAIDSVLTQDYEKIELIVVDDGSSDRTPEVVKNFSDGRVELYKHKKNKGQAAAENKGVKESNGKFIGFIDSDTIWLKGKIRKQMKKIMESKKEVGLVYCNSFNKSGEYVKESRSESTEKNTFEALITGLVGITTSKILVKKRCINEIGGWDEKLDSYIDLDLCLRMAKRYEFQSVNEPLVVSQNHKKTRITTNYQKKIDGLNRIEEKWKNDIEKIYEEGVEEFRSRFMSSVYRSMSLYHARKRNRSKSVSMLKNYLGSEEKIDSRFLVLVLSNLISPKMGNLLTYTWYRISGNRLRNDKN